MENQSQPEENLVKKTCRELGITQKELAEKLDVPLGTINRWGSSEDIPKMTKIALYLMVENYKLKEGINFIFKGFEILKGNKAVVENFNGRAIVQN